jgi:hypothetical protein
LWSDEWERFDADTIEVWEEAPRESRLLGPDGNPLIYVKPRMGFDLTPRSKRNA